MRASLTDVTGVLLSTGAHNVEEMFRSDRYRKSCICSLCMNWISYYPLHPFSPDWSIRRYCRDIRWFPIPYFGTQSINIYTSHPSFIFTFLSLSFYFWHLSENHGWMMKCIIKAPKFSQLFPTSGSRPFGIPEELCFPQNQRVHNHYINCFSTIRKWQGTNRFPLIMVRFFPSLWTRVFSNETLLRHDESSLAND